MSDAHASDAARSLARARWGSQVVERAAEVVISRRAELPAAVRAEVVERLTDDAEAGE
jgi:hypothetical protein